MQTGMGNSTGPKDPIPAGGNETDESKNARIVELRKKIESGFYESQEVLSKIVDKMLNDIKSKK